MSHCDPSPGYLNLMMNYNNLSKFIIIEFMASLDMRVVSNSHLKQVNLLGKVNSNENQLAASKAFYVNFINELRNAQHRMTCEHFKTFEFDLPNTNTKDDSWMQRKNCHGFAILSIAFIVISLLLTFLLILNVGLVFCLQLRSKGTSALVEANVDYEEIGSSDCNVECCRGSVLELEYGEIGPPTRNADYDTLDFNPKQNSHILDHYDNSRIANHCCSEPIYEENAQFTSTRHSNTNSDTDPYLVQIHTYMEIPPPLPPRNIATTVDALQFKENGSPTIKEYDTLDFNPKPNLVIRSDYDNWRLKRDTQNARWRRNDIRSNNAYDRLDYNPQPNSTIRGHYDNFRIVRQKT